MCYLERDNSLEKAVASPETRPLAAASVWGSYVGRALTLSFARGQKASHYHGIDSHYISSRHMRHLGGIAVVARAGAVPRYQ